MKYLLLTIVLSTHLMVLAESSRPLTGTTQPSYSAQRSPQETQSIVLEPNWWKATQYTWQIGYENAATNSTGILGQNVMTGGYWFTDTLGLDVYLGYTKGSNANTESIAETTDTVATPNTKTAVTSYSGTNTARTIAFAGGLKYRMVQTDWFQFNIGMVVALFPGGSASYSTGSKTETYADAGNTGNKTVTETALGTITADTATRFAIGPRLATEFYIKWFPHLAVGFATGVLTSFAGDVTTTTDTVTRAYTVTSGVEGTPTSKTTTHTVATTKPGFTGTTFGLGGTTFALTGTFSIRYVW